MKKFYILTIFVLFLSAFFVGVKEIEGACTGVLKCYDDQDIQAGCNSPFWDPNLASWYSVPCQDVGGLCGGNVVTACSPDCAFGTSCGDDSGGGGGGCGTCSSNNCQGKNTNDACGSGGTCRQTGGGTDVCSNGTAQCSCQGQSTPCTVNLFPGNIELETGTTQLFTTTGDILAGQFSSSDQALVSIATNARAATGGVISETATVLGLPGQQATITVDGANLAGACSDSSVVTIIPAFSCTVDLIPDAITFAQGTNTDLTALVTVFSGSVDQVNFTSGDPGVVSVNPASDALPSPYKTSASGAGVGSTTVTAEVIMGGFSTCVDVSNLTVTNQGPWWQAGNADIITNTDITSAVPALLNLILDGLGGFPGVAGYGGSLDTGSGETSSTNWNANASFNDPKIYDYDFFARQIPTGVTFNTISAPTIDGSELTSGGVESNGFHWYQYDGALGDLTITGPITISGTRKVVLMVDGANLNLNNTINIGTRGSGFFMAIVGKNTSGAGGGITVSETVSGAADAVPELEGLFLSEGTFATGTAGVDSDSQLHIRGSVASYGGINLQRDLADDSVTPAEYFEFAPELMLLFPNELNLQRYRWEEVSP